ncbi:unnamed protein product [Trichobilharzia szidati]|nr:unnamed protein product [Trichobilharzia szidati]
MFGLNVPLKCDLSGNLKSMTEFFIFSRVFSMNEDELNNHLTEANSNCTAVKSKLSDLKFNKENTLDCRAFTFVINRLKLLIAAYGTVISEDDPEWKELSSIRQNCERLKCQEVAILRSSIECVLPMMDDGSDNKKEQQ